MVNSKQLVCKKMGGIEVSWYQTNDKAPHRNNTSTFYKKAHTEKIQSSVSFNLTILDMVSEKDYQIISESLFKLPGIVSIKPYQQPNKLTVTYNPYLATLEQLVFNISKLGYHYVNRA